MPSYLLKRVLRALITIFIVITIAFILGRLTGSPAASILPDTATKEQIDHLNAQLGLDKPYVVQYLDYLGGILRGDFGDSYRQSGVSSMSLVLMRLPATALLGAVGLIGGVALSVATVLAIHLTGSRRLRGFVLAIAALRQSVPDFFFGLLLVLLFAINLAVLPSLGYSGPLSLVMPGITVATAQYVVYVRLLDTSLSEQASAEYVRTAIARGERHSAVVLREALPNALLPLLTFAGIVFGGLLGGLVIVENVFAWPGLGQLMLESMYARDFPVVQSGLIAIATMFVAMNLVVDLLYVAIDPRVRLK